MKEATIPAVRVSADVRDTAEALLQPGETLSAFVEQSVRRNIESRLAQTAFVERGLLARTAAQQSGRYSAADETLAKIAERVERARARRR